VLVSPLWTGIRSGSRAAARRFIARSTLWLSSAAWSESEVVAAGLELAGAGCDRQWLTPYAACDSHQTCDATNNAIVLWSNDKASAVLGDCKK
jgi:hypothetical protein